MLKKRHKSLKYRNSCNNEIKKDSNDNQSLRQQSSPLMSDLFRDIVHSCRTGDTSKHLFGVEVKFSVSHFILYIVFKRDQPSDYFEPQKMCQSTNVSASRSP